MSSTTHNQIFDLKSRVFELETEVKSLTLSNDRTSAAKVTALFTDFLTPNQVRVVLKKKKKQKQGKM
jgi:arginine/ornithine N-succinyltransferase beta subunit